MEAMRIPGSLLKPFRLNKLNLNGEWAAAFAYPLNLMNIFIPSILGKDLEASLDQLKVILEK